VGAARRPRPVRREAPPGLRDQEAGRRATVEISTRRHTLAAALVEWEKFEKDPESSAAGDAAVYLDNELAREFLAWSKNEKGRTNRILP
jgi:hypothetical protein